MALRYLGDQVRVYLHSWLCRRRQMASEEPFDEEYLLARGIKGTSVEDLTESLRQVLATKEPIVYEAATSGLPIREQEILQQGGMRLTRQSSRDLVGDTAVKFAALVEHSLTTAEVAERLELSARRVRQMIASGTLYSFRLNGKRLVPSWQFRGNERVPNIGEVNKAISPSLHPVGVEIWFHRENSELCADEDMESPRSPLQWLAEHRDPNKVVFLAASL